MTDELLLPAPIDPLKIGLRALTDLAPAPRNARTHSDRQIEQIAGSIRQFGFVNPVLVDAGGRIVAGHGRLEAARRLGMATVPVVELAHLSPAELRALALADNRIAEQAGWDREVLKLEFGELLEMDLDFDLEVTGFSTTEIDLSVGKDHDSGDDAPVPAISAGRCWIQPGDVWELGGHRLLCSDSRDPASFALLMGDERARMVFSDPPYNVPIAGHVGGLGNIRHDEFAMASGEMSDAEFTAFLETVFRNAADVSMDGALHFQCMDWRHMAEMLAAGGVVYSDLRNLCVWVKDNGGMGSLYRSQHEMVFVWKAGTASHLNNVELGRNGRYRTNVWRYPGATKTGPDAELKMHPTVKPVPMIMDAIKDTSRRGDIVLDPFGGSGSTLIAAEKTGRCARLIEFEPRYCEVIISRWEKLTGRHATHAASGATFQETCEARAANHAWDVEMGLADPEDA